MWDECSNIYSDCNYNKNKNNSIWRGIKIQISINYFCKILNISSMKYHKDIAEDELYIEMTYYEETKRILT